MAGKRKGGQIRGKAQKAGGNGSFNRDNKISKQIKSWVGGRKILGIQSREKEVYKLLENPFLVLSHGYHRDKH